VLGRRSTYVTYGTMAALVGLCFVASSWIAWAVMNAAMLYFFGPNHPRTHDEETPLDAPRLWLAGFAVVMFVICFTPAPIRVVDLLPPGR
jgi:formate hydrogenlyase subunit 3/multisubunit Na+/H+ antiporter MnhD subunit